MSRPTAILKFTSNLTQEDADTIKALVDVAAEAWEAIPDDMTGDHDTLADAIAALVAQRDSYQIRLERIADQAAQVAKHRKEVA